MQSVGVIVCSTKLSGCVVHTMAGAKEVEDADVALVLGETFSSSRTQLCVVPSVGRAKGARDEGVSPRVAGIDVSTVGNEL